jgi:four helix bundle protein
MANDGRKYDLEERTAKFGEAVIVFAKRLPNGPVIYPLIGQVVRSATSVGANYAEADDAQSKKEFLQKIGYCREEARETKHWLRMIAIASPEMKEPARALWQEARELHLIFAAICRAKRE